MEKVLTVDIHFTATNKIFTKKIEVKVFFKFSKLEWDCFLIYHFNWNTLLNIDDDCWWSGDQRNLQNQMMCMHFSHQVSLSGKKSKSVFDFLTYSRETGFSFSYGEVGDLHRPNGPSNEIGRLSKFDNSLSFDAKQNALRQTFFALWFFKDLFAKNSNEFFFFFFYDFM